MTESADPQFTSLSKDLMFNPALYLTTRVAPLSTLSTERTEHRVQTVFRKVSEG